MKLIALCGAASAGKDTVADMLPARKLAFADTLYAEVAAAWGVSEVELKLRSTKETPVSRLNAKFCRDEAFVRFQFGNAWFGDGGQEPRSPRQILQWWGDYRRAQDPDYFLVWLQSDLSQYFAFNPGGQVVITDLDPARPSEAAVVRQLGGQIWQIRRPGYEAGGTGHASDTDGSEFEPDRVIVNTGSLEDLRATVLVAWEGV